MALAQAFCAQDTAKTPAGAGHAADGAGAGCVGRGRAAPALAGADSAAVHAGLTGDAAAARAEPTSGAVLASGSAPTCAAGSAAAAWAGGAWARAGKAASARGGAADAKEARGAPLDAAACEAAPDGPTQRGWGWLHKAFQHVATAYSLNWTGNAVPINLRRVAATAYGFRWPAQLAFRQGCVPTSWCVGIHGFYLLCLLYTSDAADE